MKRLKTEFSLIQPKALSESSEIGAWFTQKNEEYGKIESSIPGLNLGFNTPENKEQVAKNRLALLASLNLNENHVAYADQVHSNRIRRVTEGGIYPSTDGLITQMPGLTLGIQVADCAAVLLWDSSQRIIAALHAGWRGAVGNIVPNGIDVMKEMGANLKHMRAFVSPCLCFKNFEVGMEVAEQFPEEFVDYEHYNKPHVNLKGFLKHQMRSSGLIDGNIEIHPGCTIEDERNYYSFRREGQQSGRMMALIQIAS